MKEAGTVDGAKVYELNGSTMLRVNGNTVEIQQDTWNKKDTHTVTVSLRELQDVVKTLTK